MEQLCSKKYKKLILALKITGILGIVVLVSVFRAGEPENVLWLERGWWGILGLIGWGYFVAATINLIVGNKLFATFLLWLFFIGLNILSNLGLMGILDFLNPVFGVIISGNVPSTVLAGLTISIFLRQNQYEPLKTAGIIIVMGIIAFSLGFVLRNWFIISKIQGTPSWVLICTGISMIVFAALYLIIDIRGKEKWALVFKPAGQNSLTTYLAPDIIYHLIWALSLPLFFYKQETSQLLAVGGSLFWALAMVGFAALLAKINIRLKL